MVDELLEAEVVAAQQVVFSVFALFCRQDDAGSDISYIGKGAGSLGNCREIVVDNHFEQAYPVVLVLWTDDVGGVDYGDLEFGRGGFGQLFGEAFAFYIVDPAFGAVLWAVFGDVCHALVVNAKGDHRGDVEQFFDSFLNGGLNDVGGSGDVGLALSGVVFLPSVGVSGKVEENVGLLWYGL